MISFYEITERKMNFNLFGQPIFEDVLPLRIPYMGSKRKIATQLFEKMLEIKPRAKYFFDLFGGGGAMSFFALQIGLQTHYNEKQKGLVDFINYILERTKNKEHGKFGIFPDDFYKFIDHEKFKILKNEDSIKGQFARICYSFGNAQKNYLFGDIEGLKHLIHNIVVFQNEDALLKFNENSKCNFVLSSKKTINQRRLEFAGQVNPGKDRFELRQLQMLEQLQHLQRLQQLEQLEQLEQLKCLPAFTTSNLDFEDVVIQTPPEETIIYLDPPYRGTASYLESAPQNAIDDYFRNSSHTCFMSEYDAPFDSVLEIEKFSQLQNGQTSKKRVIEKLFHNGR